MKKKKLLIIISIMISLFTLTGCNDRSYEYHPGNKAKKEAKIYFEYLKNKDIKELNKLFSKEVQATHNLEEEWEEFFNSIDGNIVSYEKIKSGGEGMHVDKRKVTYSNIIITYKNVKTDTGKIYKNIGYREVRVDVKNRDSEGISLFANEDEGITVGEIIIH